MSVTRLVARSEDKFKPLVLAKQAIAMEDAGYPFSGSDGCPHDSIRITETGDVK